MSRESRAGFKANLTKKLNELSQFIDENSPDVGVSFVKRKFEEIEQAQGKFNEANELYMSSLNETDKMEAKEYGEAQGRIVLETIERVNAWLRGNENIIDEVNPADSVSQISYGLRSKASSTSSKRSKTSSKCSRASTNVSAADAKVHVAAKKAALIAEANLLKQHQTLEKEKFKIEQERLKIEQEECRLKLETEIAKAEAEERVYDDYMSSVQSSVGHAKPLIRDPDVHIISHNQKHCSNEESGERLDVLRSIQVMQRQVESQIRSQFLPKSELMTFDGSPLNYSLFIKSFENNVEKYTDDNGERLQLLIQYCVGKPREVIKSCTLMNPVEGYHKAKALLKERFGDKYVVTNAWIRKVSSGPVIQANDADALQDLADDLENCEMTLRETNRINQINSEDRLVQIVERLPYFLKSRWQKRVVEIRGQGSDPTISDVKRLVKLAAKEKNDPVFGGIMCPDPKQERGKGGVKSQLKQRNFSVHSGWADRDVKFKCYLCNSNHRLDQCTQFCNKSSEEKLKFVRERKLCENCLSPTHYAGGCKAPTGCKIQDCRLRRKHLECLHAAILTLIEQSNKAKSVCEDSGATTSNMNHVENSVHVESGFVESVRESTLTGAGFDTKALPIVPVKIRAKGQDKSIEVYALLDNGSTCTWCTDKLVNKLGVNGTEVQVSLTTIEKENSVSVSSKVSLEVLDLDENVMIELPNVLSRENLNISLNGIAKQEDVDRWPHLHGVKLPEQIDGDVELLIGVDVPMALEPEEVRSSRGKGPYASKSKFGWTVNGPLGRYGGTKDLHNVNFVQADESLSRQLEQYMNCEFNDSLSSVDTAMSVKEQEALLKFESSVKLCNGHYEIGIPWIDATPNLPNNRSLALHRLNLLRKRLQRDEVLLQKYSGFMNDVFEKGYARAVPQQNIDRNDGKVWYLPHHSVVNPKKPDKVRIVFDCAAKYQGVSLNDHVLQGPDLSNGVVGVLTRFREEPVAVMSDVEAMYHQVRVLPDDVDALRFLWFPDNDISQEPKEYQMLVHLFGGVWSPSCANFALQKTVDDNGSLYDAEVAETVKKNFYVDDCLKSVKTVNDGISLVNDLSELLAKGGFHLTKWTSNRRVVIEKIPVAERAKEVRDLDLDQERLPVERALGVGWDTESDLLVFKIKPKEKPATRRGLLSIISSMYDPLGFVSPYVLKAKIILQELCRKKLGWDDDIPQDLHIRWTCWVNDLPKLEQFAAERCFKPQEFGEVKRSELHHFADASELGYGAVSYLRFTDESSHVHCAFVMGKSRVVPLKAISVPRMELSAAKLAVRLDGMCCKELSFTVDQSFFWTDSTTVLHYIENEDKRFHTFVANRLAVIHDASTPDQWSYVPSELNPADDASRGLSADGLLSSTRWIKGPEFLWNDRELWPERPVQMVKLSDDPEIRAEVQVHTGSLEEPQQTVEKLLSYYSSWTKLKKCVAWILRFKLWLQDKVRKCHSVDSNIPVEIGRITVDEMKSAEKEILVFIQHQFFDSELHSLKEKVPLKKSSPIKRLDPMECDGLLRVGGRLRLSELDSDAKHPIILPKYHHVVELIVVHYHIKAGHSGQEHVLSNIRERFWIIKARVVVRRVLMRCFSCKRRQQKPGEQKMADLPKDRLTLDKPPFTFVGVDCFGPFMVKRARSLVKRYGILFTCLIVRAVHIEVSHSLDTDSFLNACRRFIARRGQPEEIRSDNGGNFIGGERELREAVEEWNQGKIHEFLLQHEIRWTFNPPAASHMGGIWERPIRTARKVLTAILKEQTLDDEGLSTLMCEVEAVINGRPITKVSDDPNDLEALTPNHLLLLRAGPSLPPGVYCREDLYSRRRWRQVQYMADVFWKRWKKEYLPTLQVRRKWLEKQPNLEVGDIVLVVDSTTPRSSWLLGRVLEVRGSSDGCVRQAVVKTKSGTLTRPIDKLCVLESSWKQE